MVFIVESQPSLLSAVYSIYYKWFSRIVLVESRRLHSSKKQGLFYKASYKWIHKFILKKNSSSLVSFDQTNSLWLIMFEERKNALEALQDASSLRNLSLQWQIESANYGYSYTKDWFVFHYTKNGWYYWNVRNYFQNQAHSIIETGIARGGSIAFYASMLCLLDLADNVDPRESTRRVIGNIDIREDNLKALQSHPFNFKTKLIRIINWSWNCLKCPLAD